MRDHAMRALAVEALGTLRVSAARWWSRTRLVVGLEAALWLVAASSGGVFLWWLGDAATYQRRAATELRIAGAAERSPAASRRLAKGAPIATLTIPRLGLSAVVAEGADDEVLRRAIGHLPGSARPGELGNVALAGHRDTFFRPLERIEKGDLVTLETPEGRYDYRVEWSRVVEPDRSDLASARGGATLTLITCFPFRWVGDAPRRFVVRARNIAARPALGPAS